MSKPAPIRHQAMSCRRGSSLPPPSKSLRLPLMIEEAEQPTRPPVILTGDHQQGASPLLHASVEGPLGRRQVSIHRCLDTP